MKLSNNELYQSWKSAKILSENLEIKPELPEYISLINYCLVKQQMNEQQISGEPYQDTFTFNKWKEQGYKVKRGEKSVLYGITWINTSKKDPESTEETTDKEFTHCYPKLFHLFHRGQVEKIKAEE